MVYLHLCSQILMSIQHLWEHVEYCAQVWTAQYKKDIDILEWVQQMASEKVWRWRTWHEESLRELVCPASRRLEEVLMLSTGIYTDSVDKLNQSLSEDV